MEQRFTTKDAHPRDRFAYWREAVCDSYVQLECETAHPQSFEGSIDLKRRQCLSTSYVSGSNQTVSRRQRDVIKSGDDSFLLSLQLRKTGFVEQDGRLVRLDPGEFTLYDSSNRYRLTLPDGFMQLVLQFPKTDFLERLPSAENLTAMKVPTRGFGALAGDILPRLVAALDDTPDHAQDDSQNAILDLLVAAFAGMDTRRHQLHSHDQLVLLRAREFITKNLSDPDLNRDAVARAVGLSVRRLNEVFQTDSSSISREISHARLSKIAALLASPRHAHRSVSDIAYSSGVSNLQSFSRAFSKRFEQTPAEYRASLAVRR